MKILMVLHSHDSGGAERHALQLMEGLRERGHEPVFAGPMDGWLGDQVKAAGLRHQHIPLHGLIDLPSVWKLASLARREKADLIHGHLTRGAYYAGLGGKLAGVANVATAHSTNAGKHFGRADRIIAVADAVQTFLRGRGYAAERIQVVHNGIPDIAAQPHASRAAVRRELGLGDEPCLLMAARFIHAKGHDTLLQAMATLQARPWTLALAGDKSSELGVRMEALATELGLAGRVRFLGLREDVPALLGAADLFVAPSRREALSLALLEASAFSLPIVASWVGGTGEVVKEGDNGFLVPPDDPPTLAAAIDTLLADPALRHDCGARARTRFEDGFTLDAMLGKTLAVYRQALEAHSR
jgi:glycosyltransferase involved in cell wall biosynthesis